MVKVDTKEQMMKLRQQCISDEWVRLYVPEERHCKAEIK